MASGAWRESIAETVLSYGLCARIGARDAVRLEPPAYRDEVDPLTRTRNAREIAAYSLVLAYAMEDVLSPLLSP